MASLVRKELMRSGTWGSGSDRRWTGARWLVVAVLLVGVAAPVHGAAAGAEEGVWVVRFADRITDASRAAVVATGVEVIGYDPHHSYLVWADAAQAGAARRLAAVRSVQPLPASRKLSPALRGGAGPVLADVTVYRPTLARTRAELALLGAVVGMGLAGSDATHTTLAVSLPHHRLGLAAELPGVLYVGPAAVGLVPEDEMTDQVVTGNIDPATNRALTGYETWLAGHGLDGHGVKVGVIDSGISPNHPDFAGRVERPGDDQICAVAFCVRGDLDGHGTHVAGIIGGAPAEPLADPDGFVYGVGMAPAATLVDLNGTFFGARRDNLDVIARAAWRAGSAMWNASWHTDEGERAGYTATTRMMDVLSRDADLETPGSEEFLFVFSAGNAGASGPTVPKEAKNLISVGSTGSGRGIAWPLTGDIDRVSSFSSRGPTADGRVFPVLSAPGEFVVSARSPESATTCVVPPDGAGLYALCSGTSMAAPHVTGAAALVHQWWERETGTLPSPPMVKALLVNGATDIGANRIPNHAEGWGRINLGAVLDDVPDIWEDQGVVFSEPDEQVSWLVDVDGAEQLRATLAWSDAPASVGADPTLVNDLDLVVELLDGQGGTRTTWLGNVLADGHSVTGGEADRLNNVEYVYLTEPGTYRITVRAHNLPGDGIPHNNDVTDQDFALVVRGAASAADSPSPRGTVQPGAAIRTFGTNPTSRGRSCTLGWILDRVVEPDPATAARAYDGVYAALAGACVAAVGEEVRLVQEGDDPLGLADVVLQRVGFVTLSSDLGYALVRIDEANMDVVDPSMRGHPAIPTGISTTATSNPGDLARISGYGYVYRAHELVRENRAGVLSFNDGTRHGVAGPTLTNGDHGAPVANVTDGNTALGIVTNPESWLFPTSPSDGATGLSLEGLLADALEHGWDLRLRTVDTPY